VRGVLRLRACAKLNLALRVGPAGADGFHPIATVFQTVSLCDLLYARPAARGETAIEVHGAALPGDNTVRRAVDLLDEEARRQGGEPTPLHLRLVKRIPLGAGLGGGSSDAVAALAACIRLWRLDRRRLHESDSLQRLAEQIGSDVPFFLHGGTALGTGRGTRINPLAPLPPTWLVVAAPRVRVSTPAAYAAFDRRGGAQGPAPPPYAPRLDAAWMGNDLAEVVAELHPEVETTRRRLAELGAEPAQMTGSGAASFGAFEDRHAAARATLRLRNDGLWAVPVTTITARQHQRGSWG